MNLLNLFRKEKEIVPTGHVIKMWEHKGWGDNLYWFRFPGDKDGSTEWVLGTHAVRIPKPGDEIRGKMQSGRTGRWIVKKVERFSDPNDMFFATCQEADPFYLVGN